MFKKSIAALAAMLVATMTLAAQDAKTLITDATKAMGYDQIKSIEYSGPSGLEGTAMGQAQSAAKGWPHFTLKNFSRYIDLTALSGQQTALRSRPAEADGQLAGGGGLVPQSEAPNTAVIGANAPFAQKLDIYLCPPGFLKLAAAAPNASLTKRSLNGKKYHAVSFPVDAKAPSGAAYVLTGYIDDRNMVVRVETAIEDSLVGDMVVEQTFSGYRDFGGVKFPTRIVQMRAGLAWSDLLIAEAKANADAPAPPAAAGRGAPPEGGAGRGAAGGAGAAGRGAGPAAPPIPAISTKKLADGIYLITGGYRSVAVEMKDHVVLLEAPQNEMVTQAIIDEVKKTIPNKPIRYVVNTHSHADHSGGLRLAAAEGATIITHESNKPLYEKWFSNARTLPGPDALSKSGKKARFEYVGEKKVLSDAMNTVELYHIKAAHSEDTLIVYLPKIKAVFEADAFNPPAANAPPPQPINGFEKLLADKLDGLKIDYTTIISVHQPGGGDREITRADLLKNIGKGN